MAYLANDEIEIIFGNQTGRRVDLPDYCKGETDLGVLGTVRAMGLQAALSNPVFGRIQET